MFKKKKKPDISGPSNFEHRVHTGYDHQYKQFVGLPSQWQGIVSTEPSSGDRRRPMVDPSTITPVEIQPLKVSQIQGSVYLSLFVKSKGSIHYIFKCIEQIYSLFIIFFSSAELCSGWAFVIPWMPVVVVLYNFNYLPLWNNWMDFHKILPKWYIIC